MLQPDFRFDVKACAGLLREEDTLALPLITILLSAYGEELFVMDSVELYVDIEEDFNARMTESGENRVQAALMAMTTDMFYTDPLSTRSIALALYEGEIGDLVNGVLEEVELPEVVWSAYEIGLLRDDDEEFSKEVQAWLDAMVQDTAEELNVDGQEVLPYYVQNLQVQIRLMLEQMAQLGLEDLELPDIT